MKNKKITPITLMLAAACVSAGMGGAVLTKTAAADDAATYALSDVFTTTDATLETETIGEGDDANKVTAFSLSDEGNVKMKRSLPLKWYEKDEATDEVNSKYYTMTFAFKTLDFQSVTFSMETESAWATADEKTTNKITFKRSGEELSVTVNDGEAVAFAYAPGDKLTVSLEENTEKDGQFDVMLSGRSAAIGTFENVGANYAEYTANERYPFKFEADLAEDATEKAVILLYDVCGQQFDKLTADNKVTDNAAPVFVVNENVSSFLIGAAFSLDYTTIDVLKSKNLTSDLEYYQYNPALKSGDETFEKFNKLSTSVYFYDTVYYVDADKNVVDADAVGASATSVYKEKGYELVSIKMTTSDGSASATYDLAWYADADVTEQVDNLVYIPVNNTSKGAVYKYVEANEATNENVIVNEADYNKALEAYQTAVDDAAKDVHIGDDSYIYFPSLKWLFDDDNGYRNLKFTISYKSLGSSTAQTSSGLSYNGLKLAITKEGLYEFRVFANDKAGNTMKYYVDEELVEVTTSNIWDIENVPTFTFTIGNKMIKVDDSSSSKDTEILNQSYTFDDVTVVGVTSAQKAYQLYKVDLDKYNTSDAAKASGKLLTQGDLSAISYEDLAEFVDLSSVEDKDYFTVYLAAYAKALSIEIGATTPADVEAIRACFTAIEEYDSRITEDNAPEEWEAYNKYKWSAPSKTFYTAEEGAYVMLADYWDTELAAAHRAMAYKVLIVESEADVIEGENNWLKNNIVSIILFAFAGVCLIALIVLLLVKPSEETLEDVDAQLDAVAAKKEKNVKKEKKNKK